MSAAANTRIEYHRLTARHAVKAAECYAHCMANGDNPIMNTLYITEEEFLPYASKTVNRMIGMPGCFVALEVQSDRTEKSIVGVHLTAEWIDYMDYRKGYHDECLRNKENIQRKLLIREDFLWKMEVELLIEYGHIQRGIMARGFVGVVHPRYNGRGIYVRLTLVAYQDWVRRGYIGMQGLSISPTVVKHIVSPEFSQIGAQVIKFFRFNEYRYEGEETPLATATDPGFVGCGMWYMPGSNAGPGTDKEILPRFQPPSFKLPPEILQEDKVSKL
eukprot:112990_1